MEVLKQHWLGLLLCLVAVAIFSSALQFRKYRIMMAGESISPKWFSMVKWGGMIGAIVLFLTQVSHFGSWFSTDFMQTVTFKSDRDAVLGTVVYVVLLLIASLVVGAIVHKVPERWWKADSAKVFDEDKVCQFLLKDAEAGAKEILIFRDRLEGRRGYSFDVDGYNHAAFSADGCKMLAKYIDSRVPGAYTVEECHEAQGKGGAPQSSSSGALSDNSYRFSHMRLVKKN